MSPQLSPNRSLSPSPTLATATDGADGAQYRCLWADCTKALSDPEALYNHLCNDHIGRKSTNNLCLTCKWKDCGTSCAKRDHITSHLRGMPPHFDLATLAHILCSPHPSQAPYLRGMSTICFPSFYPALTPLEDL